MGWKRHEYFETSISSQQLRRLEQGHAVSVRLVDQKDERPGATGYALRVTPERYPSTGSLYLRVRVERLVFSEASSSARSELR